jgi:hypothetical protein
MSGEGVAENYGFTEEVCADFLNGQQRPHNEAAREDPSASIFDSMETVEGEFDKKAYNGKSLNDIFRNLIWG